MKKILLTTLAVLSIGTILIYTPGVINNSSKLATDLYMGYLDIFDSEKHNSIRLTQVKDEQSLEVGKLEQEERVKDRLENLYKMGLIVGKLKEIVDENPETLENQAIGNALESYLNKDYKTIIDIQMSRNTSSSVDAHLKELLERLIREDIYITDKPN